MKTTSELFQKALSVKLNGNAYWNYVSKLRGRGSKETFSFAKNLCLSTRKHKRVLGIDVLCQLRIYKGNGDLKQTTTSKPFLPKKSILLIRPTLRDNRKEVLLSAIFALGHLKDPERNKLMTPFAYHQNAEVRYAVAFALGGDSKPLSIKTLLQLTEDKDPQVRDWATFGIGSLADIRKTNTRHIREALFKRLHDTHMDPRGEALIGLAKLKDKRVIEYIIRELTGKSPCVYAFLAAEEYANPILLPDLNALWRKYKNSDDSYWLAKLKSALNACKPKKQGEIR